jgi:hypothetical protein
MLLAGQTAAVQSGCRDAVLGLSIDLLRLYPRSLSWHEACKAEAAPSPLQAPCVLSRTEQATPPLIEAAYGRPQAAE